jgi:carboxylesterase type B
MRYALTFLCAATGALAAPASNARQSGPQVTISRGTVVGKTTLNVDTFEGIPFAQPPVGNLRLKPPQKATAAFPGGTFDATKEARSCVQLSGQVDTGNLPQDTLAQLQNSPLFQTITNSGEDCLTLNVQRPSSATSTSKLPVVVWIFGGGM